MPSASFVHQLKLETGSCLVELLVARTDQTKTLAFNDDGMSEKKRCVSLSSAHLEWVACRLA